MIYHKNAGKIREIEDKGIEGRINGGPLYVIYLAQTMGEKQPLYFEKCIERSFFDKTKFPMNLLVYNHMLMGYDREFDNHNEFIFHAGEIKLRIKKRCVEIIPPGRGRKVFSAEYDGCPKDFLENAASEGKRKHKEIFEKYFGEKNELES